MRRFLAILIMGLPGAAFAELPPEPKCTTYTAPQESMYFGTTISLETMENRFCIRGNGCRQQKEMLWQVQFYDEYSAVIWIDGDGDYLWPAACRD